jgi:tol-pal system protein YbgF
MPRQVTLNCLLLEALLVLGWQAQQPKPQVHTTVNTAPQNDAEAVFAQTGSKVVFLITRQSGELHASASGIILTADGFIATNYHALQGADAVEMRYFPDPEDAQNYQSFNGVKLLYSDAQHDIAILKINSKSLSLPFLRCSSNGGCEPRIGERVYALGNPRGLTNTISEGIISALRESDGEAIIQHTAAISHGSSGGALVDSGGNLLGMNSWALADAQNLNFAISAKYLFEALSVARRATVALSFPAEHPPEAASSPDSGPSASASASADTLYSNGLRSIVTGKYEVARQSFADYLQHYGDTDLASNAQFYLGEIAYHQKQYELAVQEYDKVLNNYPKSFKLAPARLRKGMALINLGRKDPGIRELQEVMSRFPRTEYEQEARAKLNELGVR